MILHPDAAVLLAHADGELPDAEQTVVARHIAVCSKCDAVVTEQRAYASLFASTLSGLDAAEPAVWSDATGAAATDGDWRIARSSGGDANEDAAVLPLRRPSRGAVPRVTLRWAAGLLLALTATASAAIVGVTMLTDADPASTPSAQVETAVESAAVVATPLGDALRVEVTGAGVGSRVIIEITAGSSPVIGVEGAAAPRFRSTDGRVDVDLNGATAVLRLTLPRRLREVVVASEGMDVVRVQSGEVSPTAAASDGVRIDPGGLPRTQ